MLMLAVGGVRAQVEVLPSAGSTGRDGGHGWVVVPREFDRYSLVHLPPRVQGARGRDDTTPSGTVRQVMNMARPPVAMAAVGQRVVLIFEPTSDGVQARWPVRSIRAQPMGQGAYRYVPKTKGGGFEIEQSFEGAGEIVSLVGGSLVGGSGAGGAGVGGQDGRIYLLARNDDGTSLWSLGRDAWSQEQLPEDVEPVELLAGHPDRLVLVGAEGDVWLGHQEQDRLEWVRSAHTLVLDDNAVRSGHRIWLGDGPGRWRIAGDRVEIDRLDHDQVTPVARIDVERSRVGVVPMVRSGRLVFLWPAEEGSSDQPTMVTEVSAWTGRALFADRAIAGGPVSTRDFRILALAMLAMSVGVLVFVVRQPGGSGGGESEVVTLPKDTALAPPGQRVAATMMDWVMIAAIAAMVLDTPLSQTMTLVGLVLDPVTRAGGGIGLVLAVLLMAWAWGTLFEGVWGATPGKWLMGCRVAAVGKGSAPSLVRRLGRSATRNAFKWGLWPWAAAETMTPGVRHRGDQVARAAVVVDLEPAEKPNTDEDEPQ